MQKHYAKWLYANASVGCHVNATLPNFKLSRKESLMRYSLIFIAFMLVTTTTSSCKKDDNKNTEDTDCFPNTATVRQITNVRALVKVSGGKLYIVEKGSIDTKLNPCTLAQEFQVNNLQVTISGDVKLTSYAAGEPCCTDNFVITKISK